MSSQTELAFKTIMENYEENTYHLPLMPKDILLNMNSFIDKCTKSGIKLNEVDFDLLNTMIKEETKNKLL